MSSKPSEHAAASGDTAVPTLRVMRLQSPALDQPSAASVSSFGNQCRLNTTLCLPDSLEVFVGETFTAYLGILNVSKHLPIRRLTVVAQLQTPSARVQLPSRLDPGNQAGGVDVNPESGVNAIVSHPIEEAGQHILRVEVGYTTADQSSKSFRKFYRFQVKDPLIIRERTLRSGDSSCFVAVSVEYKSDPTSGGSSSSTPNNDSLILSHAEFVPSSTGLSATLVDLGGAAAKEMAEGGEENKPKTAVQLLDACRRMTNGTCFQYLFHVEATSSEAKLRGIAGGDLLGKAMFKWRKAMGETGVVSSPGITCPPVNPWQQEDPQQQGTTGSKFLVHRSGLSVDVAVAAAGNQSSRLPTTMNTGASIHQVLPVTVEPIDPPCEMELSMPREIKFLVVNHSSQTMALQLQFRLSEMTGLAVCGSSFKSLGAVRPNGGSVVVPVRFLALAAGLLRVQGCCMVDLASGREIPQPPLFDVFCVDAKS